MSDSQRIKLMLQVKQGKLTQEDAIEQVKLYEEHKRFYTPQGDITPSHSFEGTFNIKYPDSKSQETITGKESDSVRKTAKVKPLPRAPYKGDSYPEEPPRRGSLPTQCLSPPQDAATKTPGGDFHAWPDKKVQGYKKTTVGPPDDSELTNVYKDSHLLKQHSLRRCQEDNIDLNSDGMSQGESERTASSSLESVHSYSGVPSLSSSSSQGSVTLDDSNIFRQPICLARVLTDYVPSPYDKDALNLKKGDIIQVLKKDITGIWLGKIDNRIGNFKFINVELLSEETSPSGAQDIDPVLHSVFKQGQPAYREGQSMVEALFHSLHIQHLISVFLLNGYVTLDDLKSLTEKDLDELSVRKADDRAKIMTAVQLIHSGQALFREKADKKHVSQLADGDPASESDSSGSVKGDILQRHRDSKIPSPVIRKVHGTSIQKLSPKEHLHAKQKDSGFEGHFDSLVTEGRDLTDWIKDDADLSSMVDQHQSSFKMHNLLTACNADCDNATSNVYRYRTLSDGNRREPKGSKSTGHASLMKSKEFQSKIPRTRTNSLDQNLRRLPKKSHQSRCHNLSSAMDSAYTSAPSTPILQRGGAKDRLVHLSSDAATQDSASLHSANLATMYPHLAGVKTAHIRSLSQSVSRSAPASPAAIPKITPAARSSIHAHPRAGKPPRLRQKGVEARLTEPRLLPGQSNTHSIKCDSQKHDDVTTIVTILKVIGLSQYEAMFKCHGITTRQHFLDLKEKDFRNIGIQNVDHLRRLLSWQQHMEIGEMRSHTIDSGSRGQRVSSLRDKV